MRLVVPVLLVAACGGGKAPPPAAKPVEPPKPHVTRAPVEDSEPEDGVTFVSKHGHMEQAAIEAGLASHTSELSECFTTRVGKRRWLGGHVEIHWDIEADGTVTSVKLAASDLGAWSVEKCLIEIARAATFDKPVGGKADFMIPLDFASTRMGAGGADVWDEDRSLAAIGGQLETVAECAEPKPAPKQVEPKKPTKPTKPAKKQHVDPKPVAEPTTLEKPPSDVTITIYVGPHGKAQSVGFSSAKTEITDTWAECAQKAALAWRLPDPHGMVAKLAIRYRPQ